MRQDVTDAAFRLAAQRSPRASRFREEGIGDGAVRERRKIDNLQQAVPHRRISAACGFALGGAGRVKQALPQR